MVLVDYSDSESDETNTVPRNKNQPILIVSSPPQEAPAGSRKRKAEQAAECNDTTTKKLPPPLPQSFHSLYATNVRTSTSDDPSLHGGRKRQVVHVQGNWPSHVYVEWLPDQLQVHQLHGLVREAQQIIMKHHDGSMKSIKEQPKLHPFYQSALSAQLPLHISLSAPLVLNAEDKDGFRIKLTESIQHSKIEPIAVQPTIMDLVPNFEKSRWFLILRLNTDGEGVRRLRRLLDVCNNICREFGLTELYGRGEGIGVESKQLAVEEDTSRNTKSAIHVDGNMANAFHISIAWTLGENPEAVKQAIREIQLGSLGKVNINFDRVKIKIGNIVDDVLL